MDRHNSQEPDLTYNFYSKMFEAFGPSAEGLGWGSKGLQYRRFETLTRPWRMEGTSVLDVGCGICDLYQFLKFKVAHYVGLDFLESYCNVARSRFTDPSFEVINSDIYSLSELPTCDIAFASGTFNVMDGQSEAENYERIQSIMLRMGAAAEIGFSVNFLSDATTYRDKSLFYPSSEIILAIARQISRRVLITHFEFPFEFTLHVCSTDSYDATTSLFIQDPPQLGT